MTPLSIPTEQCVQWWSTVQVPELLSDIGVPSIISQKTRNIGSKLVKYWPSSKTLEIHYTGAGPMRPICRSAESRRSYSGECPVNTIEKQPW